MRRHTTWLLLLILLLPISAGALNPEEMTGKVMYHEAIQAYEKALSQAKDDSERGAIHREMGYVYVRAEKFIEAGKEFFLALSSGALFPPGERVTMAKYMAWGDMVPEAAEELRSITSKYPENVKAHILLGRYLSWIGNYEESIRQADLALLEDPGNREALLVKGDSLRWSGKIKAAADIYKMILEDKEDFNARLGLAYTYIEQGLPYTAKKDIEPLIPQYPYQEKAMAGIREALEKMSRPNLSSSYSIYNDSDDNRLKSLGFGYRFFAGNFQSKFDYTHVEAEDPLRDARSELISMETIIPLSSPVSIIAGAGLTVLNNGNRRNEFTFEGTFRWSFNRGNARLTASRGVFTDTAELIEKGVRYTGGGGEIDLDLSDRITSSLKYHYRDYSDDNSSNRISGEIAYTLQRETPGLNGGYRIEYLDFRRESGSGYFDPSNFLSHRLFLALSTSWNGALLYLEPFGGFESFKRGGQNVDEFIGGGYASFSVSLSESVSLEIRGEGGNFSLDTSSGFNYYQLGASITARF